MKRNLIILILILTNVCTYGASGRPVRIDDKPGLTTNYITSVAQDRHGVLWFGTYAGLYRFDGYRFKCLSVPTRHVGNTVMSICYDRLRDCLWVGTRSGLACLDCGTSTFRDFKLPDNAQTYNIIRIFEGADGAIWVMNRYDCITRIDPDGSGKAFLTNNYKGIPNMLVSGVDDGAGNLIIGHENGALSILDTAADSIRIFWHNPEDVHSLPPGAVNDILFDNRRNLWLATNHGLVLMNPATGYCTFFRHDHNDPSSPVSDHILSLTQDGDGTIWAGSVMGQYMTFDPSALTTPGVTALSFDNSNVTQSQSGLREGDIEQIFEDAHGNVWMANYGAGIEFLSHDDSKFNVLPGFDSTPGLDNRAVWSMAAGRNGELLLGATNSIGVYRHGRIEHVYNLTPALPHTYCHVQALLDTENGLLAGLNDNGLLVIDRATGDSRHIELPETGVNTFITVGDAVAVGTSDGLYIYRDGRLTRPGRANGLMHNIAVQTLGVDTEGRLWAGTLGNGVFILSPDLERAWQMPWPQMGSGLVKAIMPADGGDMWVLTKQSLCRMAFDGKTMTVKRRSHPGGNRNQILRSMTSADGKGLWFATDAGLHFLDREGGTVKNFNTGSSLRIGNFNDMAALCHNDSIYFASLEGVCSFAADGDNETAGKQQLAITECTSLPGDGIEANIQRWAVSSPVRVAHDDATLNISFGIADFSMTGETQYSVMMQGIDKTWSPPGHVNTVTYRNLPPGRYVFKVRSRLQNGEWDDADIASLPIIVSPPWWDTWWAEIIYTLVFGALVWLAFTRYRKRVQARSELEIERERVHNEKELNRERLQFYTNVTHELRTPLTMIIGPLEDLAADPEVPERYHNRIRTIHDSAKRLLGLINQLLEFRKTETQNRKLTVTTRNLGNFVTEIGLRYKELNRNPEVSFRLDIDKNLGNICFDPDIMATVLNNLLSNAVKYTPSGTIGLTLRAVEREGKRWVELEVADTGYGIAEDALPLIFDRYYQAKGKHQASGSGIGLALVRKLTDLHRGRITVTSTVNVGTVFTFSIEADATYPDALHTDPETPDTVEASQPEEVQDAGTSVLVVEDNDEIRQYIAESLGDKYGILQARDGREGLDMAIAYNPSLILADLMMPVMDGLEMLGNLKTDIRTSHIPVVMLTARDSILDKERGYEKGADSYLTKPFSARLLHTRIENILTARKRLAQMYMDMASNPGTSAADTTNAAIAEATDGQAGSEAPVIKLSRYDREFLERFTAIIEENISDPGLDLAFVRDKMNMSNSTMYRKIKGLTGMGGKEYIRKIRMAHARHMLDDGCDVSDACYNSGFSDPGHFRQCFRDEHGMSPSQYMKTVRNKLSAPCL